MNAYHDERIRDNKKIQESEEPQLKKQLETVLRGTPILYESFYSNLLEAAENDEACLTALREWLNQRTELTDIQAHGFSMNEMAQQYKDLRLGQLEALILIYLEGNVPKYRGIAAYAGEICYADWHMVETGGMFGSAIHDPKGWYLFGSDRGIITDPNARSNLFADYDLWMLLLDVPELIPRLAGPVGSMVMYDPQEGVYTTIIPTDEAAYSS